MTKKIDFIDSSGNFFADVGFEEHEAKKLQFKSYLMISLMKYIKATGLTQAESATRLGVTQSRMSNLLNYRIDLFSTEMLIDMMEKAGFRIYEKIELDVDRFLSTPWPRVPSARKSRT